MERSSSPLVRGVKEFFKVLFIAALIALPLRYFVAQPFIVKGPSMIPNFHEGEYLVIDELSYFFRQPHRGEVVVFRYPNNPQEFYIKRVIGLPGDKVEIKDGHIFITDAGGTTASLIAEPYLDASAITDPMRENNPLIVSNDSYFVLGDNRRQSSDSRSWGLVPRKLFIGRVVFRAWPLSRLGFFQ